MESFLDPSKTASKKEIDDVFDANELAFLFANHQSILTKRQHFEIDEHEARKIAGQQDRPSLDQSAGLARSGDCPSKGHSIDEGLDQAEISKSVTEPGVNVDLEDVVEKVEDNELFVDDSACAQSEEEELEDLQLDQYLDEEELFELEGEQLEIISAVEEEFDVESLVPETSKEFLENEPGSDATEEEDAVDWALLLDAEDEFDPELLGLLDETEVETGGQLTDEERALQMASFLGDQCELDREEVSLIAEIFTVNGWAACKTAILRELAEGTSVEELYLASQVKEIWKEHYEFYSGQASNYRVLTWPTALCIIRSFAGYPDPEEVEQMLVRLHDHWRYDDIQRRISKTFNEYIIGKFSHGAEVSEFYREAIVDRHSFLVDLELLPPSSEDIPELTFDKRGHILKKVRNLYR
ncbi:hypothetical protein [Desulfobulbus oligotrophicus]|uniref:Uncharacterized protein n=1 Tax=Desulfobulbus oligotrophicus TaxID=1909699 RepID=A0A7T5VBC0_9BACT|nr:hypothetical protein [Desulfobulbus oligotrophicus]QQG64646.1 hypothetical protein HP555_01610 [Desulfobulbus oligotrophicus]